MSVEDTEAASNLIIKWINTRKVSASSETPIPKNPSDDFSFQFSCKNEVDLPFTILQPKIWNTTVIVLAEVSIDQIHRNALESMRAKDRDNFLWGLRRDIAFAPATSAFGPPSEKSGLPKGIQFSKEICYDELSENKLSGAMRDVLVCVAYVIDLFKKEFGELKGE